jgi:hypothetical protein
MLVCESSVMQKLLNHFMFLKFIDSLEINIF